MSKLYLLRFIDQSTAKEVETYILASGLKQIEDEYSDITMIEPLQYRDLDED